MKRCAACFMFLISFVFLISSSAETNVQLELKELEWSWEPMNIATFVGSICFTEQAPETVLMKLYLTATPGDTDPGEAVFQTISEKKLTLRKQKPSYTLDRNGADSVRFSGGWKTPENVTFTRIEITCRIYNEDESDLLAEKNLVVTRSASDIARINDGKIRLNFDFSGWTSTAAIAAATVWIIAAARIILNKKGRKK